MYYYVVPFLVYVLTIPLIKNDYMFMARVVVLSLLIVIFKKFYRFKLKLELMPIIIGAIIFLFWIFLEGHYPLLGEISYTPQDSMLLFFRVFSFVALAPIIEEFFTRNFLARILIKNNWKSVRLGSFTKASFIMTALFFGFSHNRWLPGIIAGMLLNYTIYKRKEMGSVVLAHATANLLLAVYIVYTQSWFFW